MNEIGIRELGRQFCTHGRTFQDGDRLFLSYSGSAIEFCFTGTFLMVEFYCLPGKEFIDLPTAVNPRWRANWPVVSVSIDGSAPKRIEVQEETVHLVLLKESSSAAHFIRIAKATENGKTFLALRRFSYDGTFEMPCLPHRKRMLVIGDSITCGFGLYVSNDPQRTFYSTDEDYAVTYWSLAAKELDLEAEALCLSGTTLERHEGFLSDYCIRDLYPYTDRILQEKLDKYAPLQPYVSAPHDIVVVNIGTNDAFAILFGNEENGEANFEEAYLRFLKQLRQDEGADAQILCCLGPMNHYLYDMIRSAVEKTGDARITAMKFQLMHPRDGIGAMGHPNAATHNVMAKQLTKKLKELM